MTGLRPLLRLGRREAARHRARTALVAVLIGLPVMALSGGLVFLRSFHVDGSTSVPTYNGQADNVTSRGVTEPAPKHRQTGEAGGPAAPRVVRSVTLRDVPVFLTRSKSGRGRVDQAGATVGAIADPMLRGHIVRLSGRLPRHPGEVAMTPRAADRLGVGVGDTLALAVPKVTLHVVGLAGQADCGSCTDLFIAPHTVPADYAAPGDPSGVFPNAGQAQLEVFEQFAGVRSAERDTVVINDRRAIGTVLGAYGIAVFGLIWTGLVAAAALAVGARRRRRELGLLATSGADPSGLRMAVIAEGFVIGGASSVVASALGLVVAIAAVPTVRYWSQSWGSQLSIPWAWVVAAPVVGTVAASVAAAASARSIHRSTVADLLAGRSGPDRSPRRVLGAGIVLVVVGLIAIAGVHRTGNSVPSYVLVFVGGVVAAAGLCAISSALVGSMRSVRGPGSATRLVARDLSRHGVRGSAAVAALAVTVAAWAVLAVSTNSGFGPIEPVAPSSIPARTIVVGQPASHLRADGQGHLAFGTSPAAIRTARLAIRSAGMAVATLDSYGASFSVSTGPQTVATGVGPIVAVDPIRPLFTPEQRAQLAQGLVLIPGGAAGHAKVGNQLVPVAPLNDNDLMVVSAVALRSTVDRLGLAPVGTELVGYGTAVPTGALRHLGVEHSWLSSTDDRLYLDLLPTSHVWIGYAGLGALTVVMLIVLAICLALQRVESEPDDQVVYQIGASPRTRRAIAGARAGLVAAAAVVPGVVIGVVLRAVINGLAGFSVPIAELGLAIVGLPLIAWVLFAATARTSPPGAGA